MVVVVVVGSSLEKGREEQTELGRGRGGRKSGQSPSASGRHGDGLTSGVLLNWPGLIIIGAKRLWVSDLHPQKHRASQQ